MKLTIQAPSTPAGDYKIYDFCLTTDFWPDDLKQHYKQYPLSSLGQSFYNDFTCLGDWVSAQIKSIEDAINSTNRYVATLNKTDKKAIELWNRTNQERLNSINVLKSDYKKHTENS